MSEVNITSYRTGTIHDQRRIDVLLLYFFQLASMEQNNDDPQWDLIPLHATGILPFHEMREREAKLDPP